MMKLYVERIQEMLLPVPSIRDQGKLAAEKVFTKGDIQPLCEFIEKSYFSVFSNRDYRWMDEFSVKMAFLSLLYNDHLYIMDSEPEISRKYPDLTMIIRPDMRHFKILDVLIEFKYLSLKDLERNAEQLKDLSREKIMALPLVKTKLTEAQEQLKTYSSQLKEKYGSDFRLHSFAVVSLGFERIAWEKLS